MAKSKTPKSKIPKYRLKMTGGIKYAVVTLTDAYTGQRKDIRLGEYNSVESRQKYTQAIAAWNASNGRTPSNTDTMLVADLILDYWTKEVVPQNEKILQHKAALRILNRSHGQTVATEFGPNALRIVRQQMIKGNKKLKKPRPPWNRNYVNRQTRRIINMYKWAASNELLPIIAYQKLASIETLKYGEAKESDPIMPAPAADIEAAKKHLPSTIAAMIDVQLATGMRPSEMLTMTMAMIDQSRDIWLYQPADHKGTHRGKARNIYLPPKAQAIIKQHAANKTDDQPIFSPRDAMAERNAAAKCHRRPNQKPNEPSTDRVIRDHYDAGSYRRAIQRACDKASVLRWFPYQLRHNYATEIRKLHGLEAAQIMLGHSSAVITDAVYAERDENKAIEIAKGNGRVKPPSNSSETQHNFADEIRHLKAILDEGLITTEEFAAKKKQVLGI